LENASALPRNYGQRLKLVESTFPRGPTCHCADKPVVFILPLCNSAELFFSSCGCDAALPALANFNGHVAKTNISRQRPPTPSALRTAPTARELKVVKPLRSTARDTSTRATGTSCFPCLTVTRSYFRISPPPRPVSPACFSSPGCFFALDCLPAGGPMR
jgi:hypothetical protein